MEKMYFYLYKTTNKVNNMIYVGVHRTTDLNDGYLGSGTLLKRAIKKYGVHNFEKEIIQLCSSVEEMFEMESHMVNESFVKRKDTYNTRLGGQSGPIDSRETDYYKSGQHVQNAKQARAIAVRKVKENKRNRILEYTKAPMLCKCCKNMLPYKKKNNLFCSKSCAATFNNTGRVVTESHKNKVALTLKSKYRN